MFKISVGWTLMLRVKSELKIVNIIYFGNLHNFSHGNGENRAQTKATQINRSRLGTMKYQKITIHNGDR